MSARTQTPAVSAARHARAILLLPLMSTIVIPTLLLAASGRPSAALALGEPLRSGLTVAGVALAAAGLALAAAGLALAAAAVTAFVRSGDGTLAPWDPTCSLLTRGVYSRTRNPLKLGLFAILAAEALLAQSAELAAWLACFAIANVIYIRVSEEPQLRRRFGPRYAAYCARVPRWWPRRVPNGAPRWTSGQRP